MAPQFINGCHFNFKGGGGGMGEDVGQIPITILQSFCRKKRNRTQPNETKKNLTS